MFELPILIKKRIRATRNTGITKSWRNYPFRIGWSRNRSNKWIPLKKYRWECSCYLYKYITHTTAFIVACMIFTISNISKLCQHKIVVSLEFSGRCESLFCKILFFCPKCKSLFFFWSEKINMIYLIRFYSGFQNCIDLLDGYRLARICLHRKSISRMSKGSWLCRSWNSFMYETYTFLTIPISSRFYTRCCLILCTGSEW